MAIAAIFCRTISPDSSPHLRLFRRSCRRIAAGGIADARGVAAARSLGAAGVQPGTGYLSLFGSNDKFCAGVSTCPRGARAASSKS